MRRYLFAAALWAYAGLVTGNVAVMWAGAPSLVSPLAGAVGLGLFLALYGFGPAHPSIRKVRDAAKAAADATTSDLGLDTGLAR